MDPEIPEHPLPLPMDFHDHKYGVALHVPAGWSFERRDGVLSNFGVDVRSARRQLVLRVIAALNYNPYPYSTFAGATFYYSLMPRTTAAACAAQSSAGQMRAQADLNVGQVLFKHGQDQHGTICTESRDDVFTTLRGVSCLRFDLVVNTFCSQTSGAMELTPKQLGDVNTRLANILMSVKIDGAGH